MGISRWRRWLSRAWRKAKSLVRRSDEDDNAEKSKGELAFLPERTCAICYQDQNPISTTENEVLAVTGASGGVIGSAQTDVTNPYETIPCECIYCFVCIATRLDAEAGQGWICLRCGELVKECKPWAGDVLEEVSRPPSGKSVSFSDEEEKQEKLREIDPRSEEDHDDQSISPPEILEEKEAESSLSEGIIESREWSQERSASIDDDPVVTTQPDIR